MGLNYKSSLARYRRYLLMLEENATWRASLFAILSLILILVMILFALRPTVLAISELLIQIREQEALSQKLAAKIENVRVAGELLSGQSEKMKLLDQALPKDPRWMDWIKGFEEAATESGVKINSAQVGPINIKGEFIATPTPPAQTQTTLKLPSGLGKIEFAISATGTYEQTRKFTEILEKKRRLAVIEEVGYSKEKEGGITTSLRGWIGYTPEGGVK